MEWEAVDLDVAATEELRDELFEALCSTGGEEVEKKLEIRFRGEGNIPVRLQGKAHLQRLQTYLEFVQRLKTITK
jgi:hypothetical protein